ncbi:MAG: RNA-binding S4 domain-containing protein [Proteobacteria bacterium]|nr:RNA-binding S4 domain-containing protein [Pseudomonadota bacterium]
MTETFTIKGDYIELIKLLKAAGLADTGGMAKMAIEDGLVTVDGIIEYRKGRKLKNGQRVEFNNHIVIITSPEASL